MRIGYCVRSSVAFCGECNLAAFPEHSGSYVLCHLLKQTNTFS